MSKIKALLKHIIPPSIYILVRELNEDRVARTRDFAKLNVLVQELRKNQQELFQKNQLDSLKNQQEILTNQRELKKNQQEILTNQRELKKNQQEILTNQQGILTNQQGILTNQQGILTNQQGILTNQQGILTNQQGILTNQQGILTNQQGMQKNQQEFKESLLEFKESQLEHRKSQQEFQETAKKEFEKLSEDNKRLNTCAQISRKSAKEAVWAHVFHDTIRNSPWLKEWSSSPGRWAIGYPYLYLLYQALEKQKPRRILDLGLGVSTRLIAAYAANNPEVEHIVIESDPVWIGFFRQDVSLPDNTRIIQLADEYIDFKGQPSKVYVGLAEVLSGQKFDLISIDAPGHSTTKKYCRIDLLPLLPEILSPSYLFLFDDYQFPEIVNTVTLLKTKFEEMNFAFHSSVYQGEKDFCIFASPDNAFFLSL